MNVLGVGLLLAAMKVAQCRASRFYVSTYNVVYGGEVIENGNESLSTTRLTGTQTITVLVRQWLKML